jgi:hypothetical protein
MKIRMTNRGQATMSEYLIVFFLAVGTIVSMSVYIQRTLQSRIHDARDYMIEEAAKAHEAPIRTEYEPYYGYVDSIISRQQQDSSALVGPAGGTGIFRKGVDQAVIANSMSQQAPPKDAQ